MVSQAPASWKQKRTVAAPGAASLRQRRLLTSLLLVCLLATTIAVGYLLWTKRVQETCIVLAGNVAAENQFALPPIRYVPQGWEQVESLRTPRIHIDNSKESFDSETFHPRLQKQIRNCKPGDALIVWINGIGIVRAGKPVIVGSRFHLPEDPRDLSPTSDPSLIEVAAVLETMSQWDGPKLLLLDWGQEVFDPRIDCLGNNFLELLEKTMQSMNAIESGSPVWVLASHLPRQISLVDAQEKRSLFNRAVTEGLLNQRRVPEKVQPAFKAKVPSGAKFLTLDSLAEYVYRRVFSDSQGYQTPWLLKTGEGIVKADSGNWTGAAEVKLVAIDKHGLPLGLTAPPAQPSGDAASSNVATSDSATSNLAATSPTDSQQTATVGMPQPAQEVSELWQILDAWRAPLPNLDSCSEAALSPLTFKNLAAQALNLDLRAFAGFDLQSEATSLLADIEKHRRNVQPAIFAPLESGVTSADIQKYRTAVQSLCEQRVVASLRREAVILIDSLRKVRNVSLSVDELQSLARSLQSVESADVAVLWVRIPQALDKLIEQLDRAETNRGEASAVAELLLRSPALSAAQRATLRKFQMQLSLRDTSHQHWLAMPLSTPRIDAIEQTKILDDGVLQNSGRNLTLQLATGTKGAGISVSDIANADGRDILFSQDRAALWASLEQGWEFPAFPERPIPPSQWLLSWQSATSETVSFNDSVRLEGKLDLALAAELSGRNPLAFPKLTLVPQNLRLSVNQQTYDLNESVELDSAWFSRGAIRKLDFAVIPTDGQNTGASAGLTLKVEGEVKKIPAELAFELPVAEPIELMVAEKLIKDGVKTANPIKVASKFTLTPFPGRHSSYQFSLNNVDSKPHEVELQLFALPWNPSDALAEIGQVKAVDLRSRAPDFTWKETLAARSTGIAKLAKPIATPPPVDGSAKKPNPVATPTETPSTEVSIAGGCILQLFVDGESTKSFSINFAPRKVSEYVEAESQIDEHGKLTIAAQWLDLNRDSWADLAPAKLDKDHPLVIRWDPLPWRGSNDLSITNSQLEFIDAKVRRQTITAMNMAMDGPEQEIWLDVDGSPRRLIFTHLRNNYNVVSRPESQKRFRVQWRRYTDKGKSGLSYLPYTPALNDEQEKDTLALLGLKPAVFPNLKSAVEVQMAVDLPQPNERCSVLLGDERVLAQSLERSVQAILNCLNDEIDVIWTERDLLLKLDFSKIEISRDQEFPLEVSSEQTQTPLPTIIADCEPPKVRRASLSKEQVKVGSKALLDLRIEVADNSQVITGTVSAKRKGARAPMLLIEPTPLAPNVLKTLKLDVSKLEPGDYQILVHLEDSFKHVAPTPFALPKLLRIHELALEDTAPAKGDLRVEAKLPTGRTFINGAQFKIKPLADKQTPQGKNGIVYTQIPLGSYEVTVTYMEASNQYLGMEPIELKSAEDFNKLWLIELKKMEKPPKE